MVLKKVKLFFPFKKYETAIGKYRELSAIFQSKLSAICLDVRLSVEIFHSFEIHFSGISFFFAKSTISLVLAFLRKIGYLFLFVIS